MFAEMPGFLFMNLYVFFFFFYCVFGFFLYQLFFFFFFFKVVMVRLKKKILCLKACENFSNRQGMQFFIFYFIFFYFNWPLPPRTSETKNDWKVSTSVFSEIKRDFTRFLSSHVLKFFQNSKLSLFLVVKMKKKIISRKKNESLNFAKIKCAQKNKCGRQLWDTIFFFFFFSLM